MQKKQKQCDIFEWISSTYELLLTGLLEEILLLHEQIEFVSELVDSENLNRYHNEQEMQQLKQELNTTNHELCLALMVDKLSLDEAKECAKTILKSEKSRSESMAELLTAIYRYEVKPEELKPIEQLSTRRRRLMNTEILGEIAAHSQEIQKYSKQMKAQYHELGFQFIELKAQFNIIQEHRAELQRKKDKKTEGYQVFSLQSLEDAHNAIN